MANSTNTRDARMVVPVALRALEAQRLVSLIAFQTSPALAAGLIAYVRQQRFTENQTVLFWHTGGQVGLFA